MKKYLDFDDSKIAYREKNIHCEEVLLFIHGNSFSSEYFDLQFEDESLLSYRLIGLDLPGHGDSKKAVDLNTYSIPGYAGIIDSFVRQLDLRKVILVGHSLGGHIALESISRYPSSAIHGLFIWGTPPLSNPPNFDVAYYPHPDLNLFFTKNFAEGDDYKILKMVFDEATQKTQYLKNLRETDPVARESVLQSVASYNFIDEINIINEAKFEVALVNCTMDKIVSAQYLKDMKLRNLWKGSVSDLDAGHAAHVEEPQLFNQLLTAYSRDAFSQHKEVAVE